MSYSVPEIMAVIPSSVHVRSNLWCISAPVINFQIVKWYHGDRVLRQFGYIQYILILPVRLGEIHGISRRGRIEMIEEKCMKNILRCGTTDQGEYLRWIVLWICSPRQSTYNGTLRQGNHFCLVGGRWQSLSIRHELGEPFQIRIMHQSQSRSQSQNYNLEIVLIIQIWGAMTISRARQATDIIQSLISSAYYHLSTQLLPARIHLSTLLLSVHIHRRTLLLLAQVHRWRLRHMIFHLCFVHPHILMKRMLITVIARNVNVELHKNILLE